MPYIQSNNPNPVTSCGRRRTFTQGGVPGEDRTKESPFDKRIRKTTKGKGFSFSENNNDWHHSVLTKSMYEKGIEELS